MKRRSILVSTDFSETAGKTSPHALVREEEYGSEPTAFRPSIRFADDLSQPSYSPFSGDNDAESQLNPPRFSPAKDGRLSSTMVKTLFPATGILHYPELDLTDARAKGIKDLARMEQALSGSPYHRTISSKDPLVISDDLPTLQELSKE
jgi:hypothetical protein